TQINGRRFTYDSQGRLSEVYQANIYKIADYKYNALGQRIIKRAYAMGSQTVAGTTTYLYDPSGKLIGQTFYDGNGQKTSVQYWFWLDNMPLAQLTANFSALGEVSSSKLIYLHVDHLNTPRLATDSTQALLWRWNSDAYGVGAPEEDVDGDGKATTIALRFPGQIYDAQTQLSYNYYRDYNPDTGRYVQSDPIGLKGGRNTYAYVNANPMSYIDPMGLAAIALPTWFDSIPDFLPQVGRGVGLGFGVGVSCLLYSPTIGNSECPPGGCYYSESAENSADQPDENNLDKLSSSKAADAAAREAGYEDAHDAKKGEGDSKVNIYNDKTTGFKWLWNGKSGSSKNPL
ncbi:YD repeat-containing protein, partial [Pseudomonas syringae pv. actinidiae ICMP 19096]